MRKELEQIAKIEAYLLGQLNRTEKAVFETEMRSDSVLANQVNAQQLVISGIERLALKKQVKSAKRRYKTNKILKKVGVSLLVGALAAGTWIYLNSNGEGDFNSFFSSNSEPIREQQMESDHNTFPVNDSLSGNPNDYLDQEWFTIRTDCDTVIESEEGITIYIPADAFDTNDDEVDFLVQSAVNPANIMLAGLSTTANGNPLETGGMFYLDAYVDDKRVDLIKELDIRVPTDKKKSSMKLYDGEKTTDGEINWVNPNEIETTIYPVDILSLDFYPPGYEKALDKMSLFGKKFRDSLYYSFSWKNKPLSNTQNILITEVDDLLSIEDVVANHIMYDEEAIDSTSAIEGINPVNINVIWNNDFQNTFLSTREFEKRMPWIHRSCDEKVLMVYLKNLGQSLRYCDSIAAGLTSGEVSESFKRFADLNEGNIPNEFFERNTLNDERLLQHFLEERDKMLELFCDEQSEYWDTEYEKDKRYYDEIVKSTERNLENQGDILTQEFNHNLNHVKKELDLPDFSVEYVVTVATLGWKNIDREVWDLTVARESGTLTTNGKSVEIKYKEWSAKIKNDQHYDRVNVYNIPLKFNSYIRLFRINEKYSYKLNTDLDYQTLVLAWTADQLYFSQDKRTKPGRHVIDLKGISKDEFKNNVAAYLEHISNMKEEMEYIEFAQEDQKRLDKNEALRDLKNKIAPYVFPCSKDYTPRER